MKSLNVLAALATAALLLGCNQNAGPPANAPAEAPDVNVNVPPAVPDINVNPPAPDVNINPPAAPDININPPPETPPPAQ